MSLTIENLRRTPTNQKKDVAKHLFDYMRNMPRLTPFQITVKYPLSSYKDSSNVLQNIIVMKHTNKTIIRIDDRKIFQYCPNTGLIKSTSLSRKIKDVSYKHFLNIVEFKEVDIKLTIT